MKTIQLDLNGYTRREVKAMAQEMGYSISTAYRSFKRKWMTVPVDVVSY